MTPNGLYVVLSFGAAIQSWKKLTRPLRWRKCTHQYNYHEVQSTAHPWIYLRFNLVINNKPLHDIISGRSEHQQITTHSWKSYQPSVWIIDKWKEEIIHTLQRFRSDLVSIGGILCFCFIVFLPYSNQQNMIVVDALVWTSIIVSFNHFHWQVAEGEPGRQLEDSYACYNRSI